MHRTRELLHVLGEALLRENSRTREPQQTVRKLEETARANVQELQRQKLKSIGRLAAQLQQILINLVINAGEAIAEGKRRPARRRSMTKWR